MISIVIPAYNEEKTLRQNISEIISYLKKMEYEVILVDDGSKDATWDIITSLATEYNTVRGIKFSRNFGKEAALIAGLTAATGDAVIPMDSDLQDPPMYIEELVKKWKEGYKVVECVSGKRAKEGLFYKMCVGFFYNTLKRLTGIDMKNLRDFRLMDRKVVDEIIKLGDSGLFFKGMANWVGFKKTQIVVKTDERKGDTTKFNFKSLVKLAINAMTSFSTTPLLLPAQLGVFSAILGIILFVISFFAKATEVSTNTFLLIAALELIITTVILFSLRNNRFIFGKNL